MKIKFLFSLGVTFLLSIFLLDLSNIQSIIKIPVRALSLIVMTLPVYLTIKKHINIKEILFENIPNKNKTIKLLAIISLSIISMFIIRLITYKGELISFSKSLHYKDYLWLYLTFGYFLHAFLQDILLVFLYKGINLFLIKNKKLSLTLITGLFGLSHFYLGIFTVIITFSAGAIFLLIYDKFNNIFALTVTHYLLGIISIAFGWT